MKRTAQRVLPVRVAVWWKEGGKGKEKKSHRGHRDLLPPHDDRATMVAEEKPAQLALAKK